MQVSVMISNEKNSKIESHAKPVDEDDQRMAVAEVSDEIVDGAMERVAAVKEAPVMERALDGERKKLFSGNLCGVFLVVLILCGRVQESTIGAAFFTQVLSLNEATVKFDIWDIAGQECYDSLSPMYYRSAAAAIVVYDITSMKWVQQVQRHANLSLIMFFVANKANLGAERKVAMSANLMKELGFGW
ncbi:hypothetical protein Ahy_B09g097379 [Arachis hypogaea]|uniref:Uncharacterized protein n=1 Tax=Arachis hypogaea TaxID=3818 RepID=A0A444XP27_ARAHY|nr:hypothetical protein Ahy_B09g097379 [Arachis hypogaea]